MAESFAGATDKLDEISKTVVFRSHAKRDPESSGLNLNFFTTPGIRAPIQNCLVKLYSAFQCTGNTNISILAADKSF